LDDDVGGEGDVLTSYDDAAFVLALILVFIVSKF
jgi:hypothetical protein